MNPSELCVYVSLSESVDEVTQQTLANAKSFADKAKLSFFSGPSIESKKYLPESLQDFSYVLYYAKSAVSILQFGKGAPGPVSASFIGGKTEHRLKFGGGKGQMIAKAVGLNKGVTPSVLDATAGLGRDAFVLASLGCRVRMLERSPVVAELLRGALNEVSEGRYTDDGDLATIVERMSLVEADATSWLNSSQETVADVIYLDPMYPHRDKSSLVKKEMRLFQALVGEDLDDKTLLEAALSKARFRVVVKRPRKGDSIQGIKPSLQLTGKSCRYDIYTIKRIEDLAD